MIYNDFYSDCLNFIRTIWNRPYSQPFCEWLIYSWCLDGSGNETQYSRWHWWFHAVSVHVHTEPLDSTFPRLHNNHKQTVKPPQANAVQQRHNCFHNSIIDNTITRREGRKNGRQEGRKTGRNAGRQAGRKEGSKQASKEGRKEERKEVLRRLSIRFG